MKCVRCSIPFEIAEWDLQFYTRMEVPPPTHCPQCRQQRRLAFNNELTFYHRKCDHSGDNIIALFSTDKPYKVYKQEVWWGDEWDAADYGRPIDFARPFFEQYEELSIDVPYAALQTNYQLNENSDYTNYAGSLKDCYLIAHADYDRDCYYGYGIKKCNNVVNCYNVFDSELCHDCVDCQNCYELRSSQNCLNCTDSILLRDCIGCQNCIGCVNLRQKQYCIFNEQHTKESYEEFLRNNPLGSHEVMIQLSNRLEELFRSEPHRCLRMLQTEESFGDQLFNCQRVESCFDIADLQDGKYCYQLYMGAKDCMDMYQFGLNAELVYEGSIIGYNTHNARFCHCCNEQGHNLTYCMYCAHSSDLFGCIGLRRKKNCILNQAYTEHEYGELTKKLIAHMTETGEWGEFFPISISPFGYNETTAQLYFPLTEKETKQHGYKWHNESESTSFHGRYYDCPDLISDVADTVTKEVLLCESTKKPFKIIKQELDFYRQFQIPLPRFCPDERHRQRLSRKNPRSLRDTTCQKCATQIKTSFPEGQDLIIYCDSCYQSSTA